MQHTEPLWKSVASRLTATELAQNQGIYSLPTFETTNLTILGHPYSLEFKAIKYYLSIPAHLHVQYTLQGLSSSYELL